MGVDMACSKPYFHYTPTHHSVNMVANLKLKVLVKIRFSFAKTIKDKLFPSPTIQQISMSILLFFSTIKLKQFVCSCCLLLIADLKYCIVFLSSQCQLSLINKQIRRRFVSQSKISFKVVVADFKALIQSRFLCVFFNFYSFFFNFFLLSKSCVCFWH